MAVYAANTEVTSDKSRTEIERTLLRYGATSFAYGLDSNRAVVQFVANDRRIRLILPLPDRDAPQFRLTPNTRKPRTTTGQKDAWEQAVRQRWRSLALWIKAMLEAVESGIVTFEDAFLPYTVLPSGMTVANEVGVQISNAYAVGAIPRLEITQ